MIRFITTFCYTGLLRPAPGTWGSLATLPFAYGIYSLGGLYVCILATLALTGVGYWATAQALVKSDDPDPSEIVIDEVAGMMVALWPVFIGATHMNAPVLALWPGWLTAFLAFRLFDIWKPGPIGWADQKGGALGVMLDDILAGVCAAICVMMGAMISHGALGL